MATVRLNDNPDAFALWNAEAATDINTVESINMTGLDITKDQMIQLYFLIYPFIASEFSHRDDIQKWAKTIQEDQSNKFDELNDKLSSLKDEIQSHVHIGNLGSITTTSVDTSMSPILYTLPSVNIFEKLPEDNDFKFGEVLIVDKSDYAINILHRNITEKAQNYTPKETIEVVKNFDAASKFIPKDLVHDTIDTNDNNFANLG